MGENTFAKNMPFRSDNTLLQNSGGIWHKNEIFQNHNRSFPHNLYANMLIKFTLIE